MNTPPSPTASDPPSPTLGPADSSTALVLVHDEDDDGLSSPFPEFDDDEDQTESVFELARPSITPLSQTVVFIYLLSPLLKLGALLLPNTEFPLKYGLPSFLFFALLSAFSRQIWYNLALYIRNPDMETVILDSIARGRNKESFRSFLRGSIRTGTRLLRMLVAAFYLRESVHSLAPLFPSSIVISAEQALIILFAILLLPLSFAESLASRRVLYCTTASIVCFVVWLSFTSASYARGTLQTSAAWLRVGLLWQGMTVTAFAFTSSSTLSLYASSKGAMQAIVNPKKSHRHSFRLLSSLSVAVAAALMLPLVFFSAYPRHPQPLFEHENLYNLKPYILTMHAATLLLSIPFVIVTSPPLPISDRLRRATNLPISRTLYVLFIALIALVPHSISVVLSDILIVFALGSTYFLPALVHVVMHQIKRPLSIVMPQTYSPLSSTTPLVPPNSSTSEAQNDPLLQRKERSLQRRQMRKRIIWDLGVWVLLIPVGGGGIAWMIGEIAGRLND